jgi:hypothetical protein
MTVFDEILAKGIRTGHIPARTEAAKRWYRNIAKGTTVQESELLKDTSRTKKRIEPGSMFMFQYDPKTKDKLPFYDRFPLVFPIETAPGGFIGLNLHYLPHRLRAKLMDALYKYATDESFTGKTKIAITYKILKGTAKLKLFKPCIKRYLSSHIESNLIYIFPSEWDMALFLPLERFEKKDMKHVHDWATRMIYG